MKDFFLIRESVKSAAKKPENYIDPISGKTKTRMVPVDKNVVDKDAKSKIPVSEEVDTNRLRQLANLGLVDKSDVNRLMQAMKKIDSGKDLSMLERKVVLSIVGDLVKIITGDTAVFQKARKAISEAKEDDEPASPDESSMAMTQLEFIEYAAEEIMDHIQSGKRFPEWMQNKLTKVHTGMEGLHSSLGDHEGEEEMDEMNLNLSRNKNAYLNISKSMGKDKIKKDLEALKSRLDKDQPVLKRVKK